MSPKNAFFVYLLAFLLTACLSPAAVTPAASPLPPAPPPTPSALPTPEATATPKAITAAEIGLDTSDLKKAFKGAEKTVTQEEDGSYTVESFYYGGKDGTQKIDAKYAIDTASWNANPDIKDDLNLTRPLEVSATRLDKDGKPVIDKQGQEVKVKLLWMGREIGWFEALDMSKSDMAAIAKEKTLTPEDFANNVYVDMNEPGAHLALLMSARAYYAENGAPYNEDALKRLEKYGMNTLLFEHFPDSDAVVGALKNRGEGDRASQTYDNTPLKYLMTFRTTNRNGQIVHYFIGGNLAPQDLKDKASVNDFLMMIMTNFEGSVVEKDGKKISGDGIDLTIQSNCDYYASAFRQKPNLFPRPIFYANDPYEKIYPEVYRVLHLKNNDPGEIYELTFLDSRRKPIYKFSSMYETGDTKARNNKDIHMHEEGIGKVGLNGEGIYTPLPRELQKLIFVVFNVTN